MDHKLYKSILNQDQRNETSLHFPHKLISKGDIKESPDVSSEYLVCIDSQSILLKQL